MSPQSATSQWVKWMCIDLGSGRNVWFSLQPGKAWTERSAVVSYYIYVLYLRIFWHGDFSLCVYKIQWNPGWLGSNIPSLLLGWSVSIEFDAEISKFFFSWIVLCLLHYCGIYRKSDFLLILLFVGLTIVQEADIAKLLLGKFWGHY